MSKIQVDTLLSRDESAPIFVDGASVASGKPVTSPYGLNIVGVVTSTSLVGNGSALTGRLTNGRSLALTISQIL